MPHCVPRIGMRHRKLRDVLAIRPGRRSIRQHPVPVRKLNRFHILHRDQNVNVGERRGGCMMGSGPVETGPVMVDAEQYHSALAPDFSTSVLNFAVSLWMKAGSSFAPMFAIEMESLLSK